MSGIELVYVEEVELPPVDTTKVWSDAFWIRELERIERQKEVTPVLLAWETLSYAKAYGGVNLPDDLWAKVCDKLLSLHGQLSEKGKKAFPVKKLKLREHWLRPRGDAEVFKLATHYLSDVIEHFQSLRMVTTKSVSYQEKEEPYKSPSVV